MKFVFPDSTGRFTASADTGGNDVLPMGAIAWPDGMDFKDSMNWGKDSATGEFVRAPMADAPSEFHRFDFTAREWLYQADIASTAMRSKRDWELMQMDMAIANPLRWQEMSQEKKDEWANYRQALLDVPQQQGFPATVSWPKAPAA